MRSFIWKHFNRLQDNYEKCKCHYFEKEMSCPTKSGTSNLKRYIVGCKAYMAWKAANAFKDLSVLTSDEERNLSLSKVPEQVFKDATNELILLGELPLAFVESLAWKHFCSKVQLQTPVCRKTFTKEIVAMYASRKALMKKVLRLNKQRLSIQTYGLLPTLRLFIW